MSRPPLRRRPELRLQKLHDLAPLRKPVQAGLAEDFLAVDGHLETAAASGFELEAAQHRRPAVHQLLSQAHGLGQVVSRDAELDRDFGFGVGHQSA